MRARCYACGDTVEVEDGVYNDHGACGASGKPVPADVVQCPSITDTGRVGSVGYNLDGEPVLAIGKPDCVGVSAWFSMLVDEDTARAFGPHIGRRVRVTVEVIDDPEATSHDPTETP